jgi:serine phosphatase RsbU (regulator of sigma subunit)
MLLQMRHRPSLSLTSRMACARCSASSRLELGDCSYFVSAALLMANLQANLQIQGELPLSQPRELLRSVNQVFHQNTVESAYATLFFGEYDDKQRRLRYANCGHLPPLLLRCDNTLERFESTGTVLGLLRDWDCLVEERTLCPGDTLAIYTDRITEAFNDAGEEFGEERLIDSLRRHRQLPAQGIMAAVADEVRRFSGCSPLPGRRSQGLSSCWHRDFSL